VAVSGSTAYVADGRGGLRVVDVSDPANPTEVGAYDTPGRAGGVAVSGSTAYVADGDGGLRVVDVSDPANPTEVGAYYTPGRAGGVAVASSDPEGHTYAYVADEYGGLLILRYTGGETTHSISGHVRDSNGNPIPGVTVSAGSGSFATTDAGGAYAIGNLITGTYTLTPSKEGYDFSPRTRTVSVPPDATGQDFTGKRWVTSDGDPPSLLMGGSLIDEDDSRISLGDHAHLRITVKNNSDETLENAEAQIMGEVGTGNSPTVLIHNGTSWNSSFPYLEFHPQSVSVEPATLEPGEKGHLDFWIYVTNRDPDSLETYPAATWIEIEFAGEVHKVDIPIEPNEF
jgi:hypothetical protein